VQIDTTSSSAGAVNADDIQTFGTSILPGDGSDALVNRSGSVTPSNDDAPSFLIK
jgi:hypothetical protein